MAIMTDTVSINHKETAELIPRLDPRLTLLREDVMARHGSFLTGIRPYARDVALWRVWRPEMSMVQLRAALLLELVRSTRMEIPPGWRLAGEHIESHVFGRPAQDSPEARTALSELSDADFSAVVLTTRRWEERQASTAIVGDAPHDVPQLCPVYWGIGWVENHSIRDYPKVLRLGFIGIRDEIQARIERARLDEPDYPHQQAFWSAALDVCEAACLLGERYATLAADMARDAMDSDERARLEEIAEVCRRVPAHGARTLREAVQSLWLAHIFTCGEDNINANSIGRLDQMLHPYYEADFKVGRVTREEAVDLMAELACKLYLDYEVQAIVLGGVNAQGEDASNEMTHIILEATDRVGFVRDLSVRLHPETPARVYADCARLIQRGGGIPFLFNDACFIPALTSHGIALDHARDYAPIGCIELTIPGKANPHAVSGWFNSLKSLELALFNGRDPKTGEQMGPETGELGDFVAFEDLLAAYHAQVEFFAARMVYHCNRGELRQQAGGPLPCWSVLTDDCIERGRDIMDGGPIYNYHSICFMGTANTADSLFALKRLMFEDKRLTADEILSALRTDYIDMETIRQLLLTGAPKYGNDVEEVDLLAADIASHFISLMDKARSPLNGRYFVHLFTFLLNLDFGKATGATPDGRHAGEPLAYSLSSHQGRDQYGATAMLSSLARLPHERAAGATAAILDLDPKLVEGVAGEERLAQLLQAAMNMGVGQLQINITNRERLLRAQADLEHYGNISVRVAGYSQMFKFLTPELQNHVIARTKHMG